MTRRAPTIVVVDDDPSARRGIDRLLRSAGYRVVTFASALEFLSADELQDIGCLVLDVRMAGLSGLDLQDMLAARGRRIPIVFISGHSDLPVVASAMKGGAVAFLSKPFEDEALFEAIRHAIEHDGIAPPLSSSMPIDSRAAAEGEASE